MGCKWRMGVLPPAMLKEECSRPCCFHACRGADSEAEQSRGAGEHWLTRLARRILGSLGRRVPVLSALLQLLCRQPGATGRSHCRDRAGSYQCTRRHILSFSANSNAKIKPGRQPSSSCSRSAAAVQAVQQSAIQAAVQQQRGLALGVLVSPLGLILSRLHRPLNRFPGRSQGASRAVVRCLSGFLCRPTALCLSRTALCRRQARAGTSGVSWTVAA